MPIVLQCAGFRPPTETRLWFTTLDTNIFTNTNDVLSLIPITITSTSTSTPTVVGTTVVNISPNVYYKWTTNGSITLNATTTVEFLVVGAGGRGGSGANSGGGGAGEVIAGYSASLTAGTYAITVGIDSDVISNRISKVVKPDSTNLIIANGGGDGGTASGGGSTSAVRQYPPQPTSATYTYTNSGTTSTINITSSLTNAGYGLGTYNVRCSSSVINYVDGVFDYN